MAEKLKHEVSFEFGAFKAKFNHLLEINDHQAAILMLSQLAQGQLNSFQTIDTYKLALRSPEDTEVALYVAQNLIPESDDRRPRLIRSAMLATIQYWVSEARKIATGDKQEADKRIIATGYYARALSMITVLEHLGGVGAPDKAAIAEELKYVSHSPAPSLLQEMTARLDQAWSRVLAFRDEVKYRVDEYRNERDFTPWVNQVRLSISRGDFHTARKDMDTLVEWGYENMQVLECDYWNAVVTKAVREQDIEGTLEGLYHLRQFNYGDEEGMATRAFVKIFNSAKLDQRGFEVALAAAESLIHYNSQLSEDLVAELYAQECDSAISDEHLTFHRLQRAINLTSGLRVYNPAAADKAFYELFQMAPVIIADLINGTYNLQQFGDNLDLIKQFYAPLRYKLTMRKVNDSLEVVKNLVNFDQKPIVENLIAELNTVERSKLDQEF